MAWSTTYLGSVLKSHYNSKAVDLCYEKYPGLALVEKDNKFGGDYLYVPVKIGKQAGRSRTFTTAQTNASNPVYKRWIIDVVKDYVDAQVPRDAYMRCRGKEDAVITLFADQIDDALAALIENEAQAIYRSYRGVRGIISSGYAGTALTLTNVADIALFEVGMVIGACQTNYTARSGSQAVTAVDRINGTITGASNWNTAITSLADGDYLVTSGDLSLSVWGIADWLCASNPGSGTTIGGLDRSGDSRLWGTYFDGRSYLIEEAIKKGCSTCQTMHGGEVDVVLMHGDDHQALELNLINSGLFKRDVAKSEDGIYGFEGMAVSYGGQKPAVCVSDPKCPKGKAYGLTTKDWHLTYMGPKVGPHLFEEDGQVIRVYNADSLDIRCGSYSQLYCDGPGRSVYIQLA